jgi:hypothetical protein
LEKQIKAALKPTFAGEELVYSMRPLMTQQEARLIKQLDLGDAVEKRRPDRSSIQSRNLACCA